VERGEIWWASLARPRGSEPGNRRPVLVVQSDDFNRSGIVTVVVAAITSNLALALAPGNVPCRPKASGLPRPSVVNVSQLVSVSRDTLRQRVSRLPEPLMQQVDEGLRLVLSLQ
jgi:mRNA interferase MazF